MMSDATAAENWDNEFVKEILWMLKEAEDVIDDQLSTEKRKLSSKDKIRKLWAQRSSLTEKSYDDLKGKLELRKMNILEKILTLVKKRLGYDIDYSKSIFNNDANPETKVLYKDIAKLCSKLELPGQLCEYIHLVIFSMVSLKYLSDLEYIYRVNCGTIFRDREFKANKFLHMRYKLHRYILNFTLMSFHPFMIRFNKLRATLKTAVDTKFYYINMTIDDFIVETKRIWKRPSVDSVKLDNTDQEELKKVYEETREYLQENCFVWLEKFKVEVSGELCHDEFEEEEEEEQPIQRNSVQDPPVMASVPNAEDHEMRDQVQIVLTPAPVNPYQLPPGDIAALLAQSLEEQQGDFMGVEPVQPVFANPDDALTSTRRWQIFGRRDFDAMSQTNSSKSDVLSLSGELPGNARDVASTSGSESTYGESLHSFELENPRERKRQRRN